VEIYTRFYFRRRKWVLREREREKERSEDVVGFGEGAESNGKRKKGRF
jgi:hypothetical protein